MKKEDVRFSFDNISWLKKKQKNNAIEKNSEQAQVALLKQLNIQLILTRKLTEKSLTYDKDKKQYVSRDNKRVNKQSAFDIRKSVFLPQKKLNEDEKQKKQSSELPSLVKNVGMVGVGIGIAAIITTYAPMMWPFVKGMLKQMLPTFITEAAANISEIAEKFIGLFKEGGAVYDAIEWFKESTEQVADFLSDMNPFTSKDEKEIRKKEKEIQKELKKANKAKPDLSKSDWAKDDTKKISDKKNDDSKSQTNELEQNQNIIDKETEEFSKDTDEESGKQPESETQQQSESGTPQSGTPQQQSESGTQQPESRTQQQPESRTLEQPPPPTPETAAQNQRELNRLPYNETAAQNQRELNRPSNSSPKTQPTSTQTKKKGTLQRVPAPTTNKQQQSTPAKPTPSVTQQPTQPPVNESTVSSMSDDANKTQMNATAKITSPYGWRIHPIRGERQFHPGVDVGGGQGVPIFVTVPVDILSTRLDPKGYGNFFDVKFPDGTFGRFAHMLEIKFDAGSKVPPNSIVGLMGGQKGTEGAGSSTGPHLHYEHRKINNFGGANNPDDSIDPMLGGINYISIGKPESVAIGQEIHNRSMNNHKEKNTPTTHNVIIGVNTTKTAGLQKNA